MRRATTNHGTEARQSCGGGCPATPAAVTQLLPRRTAKLRRAYRFACHRLFSWLDWRHWNRGRWGGSDAEREAEEKRSGVRGQGLEDRGQGLEACASSALCLPPSALLDPPSALRLPPSSSRGYNLLRLVVALLLLTAGALKGYDLSTGPVAGDGLLNSRWFLIVVVEMELFFGLWLLANICPKLTWAATLACFTVFTCVSLYKAVSGEATCGCFGRVPVNPWYTATLDLAIVLSLLYWRPQGKKGTGPICRNGPPGASHKLYLSPFSPMSLLPPGEGQGEDSNQNLPSPFGRGVGGEGGWLTRLGLFLASLFPLGEGLSPMSPLPPGEGQGEGLFALWPFITHHSSFSIPRVSAVLLAWLCIGLPAAYAMTTYSPATLSDAGDIIGDGKTVVLDPEKWIGKRFPLLDHIDIGDKLKEGKWLVLLYHHDCPKCQQVIRDLLQTIREVEASRVALIDVPPYGDGLTFKASHIVTGRLESAIGWFVQTPQVLTLVDSLVLSVDGHVVADIQGRGEKTNALLMCPNNMHSGTSNLFHYGLDDGNNDRGTPKMCDRPKALPCPAADPISLFTESVTNLDHQSLGFGAVTR